MQIFVLTFGGPQQIFVFASSLLPVIHKEKPNFSRKLLLNYLDGLSSSSMKFVFD